MRNIEHYHPDESYEKGRGYIHELDFIVENHKIGEAQLLYKNSPFPFYYLSSISIQKNIRGNGWGGELLLQINTFLMNKKTSGILVNSIDIHHPAHEIYLKHGWQPVLSHPDYYIFQPPKNLSLRSIDRAVYTIDKMLS